MSYTTDPSSSKTVKFESPGQLTERFDRALLLASKLHHTQVRKGSNVPYLSHLLAVSALVLEHGGSEDEGIAALLHDAVEDQGGHATLEIIRDSFGEAVAAIVADCTDAWVEPKPPWRARKAAYIHALPRKPQSSLLVSLADKVHNAETILGDSRVLGDQIWKRFKGGKEGTIWYYKELSAIFDKVFPGPLAARLSNTVQQLSI